VYVLERNFVDNITLITKLLIIVLISRLALCFVGYLGLNIFPMYDIVKSKIPADTSLINLSGGILGTNKLTLESFNKFDSGFYFQIVDNGYPKINMASSADATRISFFPLYPLLIKAMRLLGLGLNNIASALILSNGLLVLALYYIYKICEDRGFERNEIYLVIALILIYPSSIFYSVPYTESLFLFLSAVTIFYATRGDYLKASISAGLSSVSRFPGVVNIAYVFFMLLAEEELKTNTKNHIKKSIGYMATASVPLIIYFSYMKYLTGDFLAPLHDVSNWGRKLSIPFQSYVDYILHPYFTSGGGWNNGVLSFVIATVVIALFVYYTIANYKKLNPKQKVLLLYGFLIIVVPFSNFGSELVSIPRYLMVSIPMYIYIVELYRKREFIFSGYLYLFAALNTLITIGYFNGYYFVV
jgi:Gpi18-like mannosyltransferase